MKAYLFFFNFAAFIFLQCFLDFAEAGIKCELDGVCRDTKSDNDKSTVCKNCKSCTYKNCCNKVYTSPRAECRIKGWRAKGYKGDVPVDIGATVKRDVGCFRGNPCQKGFKCVAYDKNDKKGFCLKEPRVKETLAALIADLAEAGFKCELDGVCKETNGNNDKSTVCKNCKSCTYHNCCNKVYTSPRAECRIKGWRAKHYKGDVPVDIGAPKKRADGCFRGNPCQKGYKCVAYDKNDDKGFCWKEPRKKEALAALIAVAGLFIIFL
ncbi:hypothetical protein niasHT_003176 [Heterodera trifolii]|uniref:Uncharacterized protein n=1 Tax=Heterodera trifolii TaxID=157864 RepID=A0ABD2MB89_9BILA